VKKPLITLFGSMGDVKVRNSKSADRSRQRVAIVMDHSTARQSRRRLAHRGIIGFPFFARFKMTLDYKAKTLTFVPTGYEPPTCSIDAGPRSWLRVAASAVLSASGRGIDTQEGQDEDAGVTVTKLMQDGPPRRRA